MLLKVVTFNDEEELAEFVNKNSITKEQIQQITAASIGYSYEYNGHSRKEYFQYSLFYWE